MEDNNKESKKSPVWEFFKYAIVALIVVVPFRVFIAQPYIVSGSSMDPTFKNGDYLIVDQLSQRFEEPDRGAVLIIRYPRDPSKFFLKRLIAFPGEKVEIKGGEVKVYNEQNPDGIRINDSYVFYPKVENFNATLGNDEYFVMGDNRAASSDSRIWGSLPRENIVGRPLVRLLPLNKIDLWPGIFLE